MSAWALRRTGQRRGMRRGEVFAVRLTNEERDQLAAARDSTAGPDALGPWLVWAARAAVAGGVLPSPGTGSTRPGVASPVVPDQVPAAGVLPDRGITPPATAARSRVILDLCAGSGAWSMPYERAGYEVIRVTLPDCDVKTYSPPAGVWGVLAAPPCDQFSLARNGHSSERDFFGALEVVLACVRVAALSGCRWWALENPVGLLGRWLGTPRDVWEPYEFGDAWTKRTALWGNFSLPERGPFVRPTCSAMDRTTPALRAVTPPGFCTRLL